jgi:phosphatidylglycerophosphate synthase
MKNTSEQVRVNDILLGPLERPALKWLAAHTPAWITPDRYTALGVLGAFIIFFGYVFSRYHPAFFWLASFGFFVNWLGDSLDGSLARHRHIERPIYGFYIDHVTDAFTETVIFVGLGLSPFVNLDIAMLALVAYLLMSVLAYVRTCVVGEFRISYGKLGPTEARLMAVLLNTAMFIFGAQGWLVDLGAFGQLVVTPYDLVVAAIALVLFYIFTSTSIREGLRLAKENR